jgi:hypothetical protein
MANSIGWGNIYCSSYWGDEDYNTRAIGDVPTCFGNAYIYADAYFARAIAANSITEGYDCLVNKIDALNFN